MPDTDECVGMTSLANYESMNPELLDAFVDGAEVLIFEAPEYDCSDAMFEQLKDLAAKCVKNYAQRF